MEGEDVYTPAEAARILGLTDHRIRQMVRAGDLEGGRDDAGHYRIPRREVHRLLEERPRRERRPPQGGQDATQELSELRARVEDLQYRLGRSEAARELTERAESSVQEERDRLLQERDRERERADELQQRLDERSRGFWRRLFGGG